MSNLLRQSLSLVFMFLDMHATWVMLQNWQTCCSRSCYQSCLPSWWTSVYSSGNSSCKSEYRWSWTNHTDASQAVVDAGGFPISLICDNCPTNQVAYDKFMGKCLGRYVYCVYDYIHIFKNIRNNWIGQQLLIKNWLLKKMGSHMWLPHLTSVHCMRKTEYQQCKRPRLVTLLLTQRDCKDKMSDWYVKFLTTKQ